MPIISYMSRLNSSQVTLPRHQPHYLQRGWRIPRRIGMLKYENWVYCPPDDQYAPKKLQRDCVWLSHLKGFAYICSSLCNRLPALRNTSIWKRGELSRAESTGPAHLAARPAIMQLYRADRATRPMEISCADEHFQRSFYAFALRSVWFAPRVRLATRSLGKGAGPFRMYSRSESKRTLWCEFCGDDITKYSITWWNSAKSL